MKPAFLLAIPILFSAVTASAAVDPALLALMPPDAAILFGLQTQNVLASPFGQYAVAQIPANNNMVQFAAATGFDYQHDLQEVLGATSAANGTKASLVLARGDYQISKFLALAAVTGSTLTYYNGTQIVSLPAGQAAVAFLDSSTLAIGSPASLEAAIDRHAAHAQFSGPLANKAIAASATADAWFATVMPVNQFVKPNPGAAPGAMPGSNVLQQVLEASGGLQFNSTGAVIASELTTASAQQAQAMLAVLRLIAAMAQSNAPANPNAAQAAATLSAAQFTVNGAAVDVTIPIPEQALEQMYSTRPKTVKKASVR